jgi:Multiubiquitin
MAAEQNGHDNSAFHISVGDAELNFRPVRIDDPVPTGRQILEAAGVRIPEEHLVFQILRDGELEELRQDETTDLRGGRAERFLIFPGAESFRIELDGQTLEWGACAISGRVLKMIAKVDPKTYGVWLEVRGAEDRPIGDTELVRLDGKGLERFFTGISQTTEGGA